MRALVAFVLLAASAAAPVGAQDVKRLRPGVFLYAAPGLASGAFTESVVLLVRHEGEGSLGLIVNRPTKARVRDALRDLGELRELELPLHFGGPVEADAVLALVRSAKPVEASTRVLPDVYLVADTGTLKAAARQPDAASRLRVYAGYAGWSAGQLAGELRQGAWIVAPADARSIFTADPSSLWPRVYDLLRRIEVRQE
jgi:putative transcriptional regulator